MQVDNMRLAKISPGEKFPATQSTVCSMPQIQYSSTVKRHFFMCVTNLCEFIKMDLLINICDFCLCILALYALQCMAQ